MQLELSQKTELEKIWKSGKSKICNVFLFWLYMYMNMYIFLSLYFEKK